MQLDLLSLVVVFLPLVSAFFVGLNTANLHYKFANLVTTAFAFVSALASWIIFYYICFEHQKVHIKLMTWFTSGIFSASWSIYIDVLTAVMLVVVNSISALVHLYSIGYMSHDEHKQRFMSYLSLFTFFMLVLVSADNFAQLFVGWEGVGLSSYLLIGFWFQKRSAYIASMKAFLVNRVGDIGLALGIFLIAIKCSSLEYLVVFAKVASLVDDTTSILGVELDTITCICMLLFIGCMGKSAQIGLHTWLPDAMEGPTPVSALIHAATMVTAGVFLLARTSYIFEFSEIALQAVTIVGAITCLFAATIAIAQNDIKKIIAYSTCSQLGYMFFACGVSAYSAAIFHLATHAFFKALLFLSAGSVIHALHNEQNIKKMGGIWRKLPYTYSFFWIGSIALAGIPPLSGFFSKDVILEAAYATDSAFGKMAYWLGISAAVLTAFYSFRLLFLVFHCNSKIPKSVIDEIHESPASMMVPLFVLGLGSMVVGFLGHYLGVIETPFWSGALYVSPDHPVLEKIHHIQSWAKVLPIMASCFGIFIAYIIYIFTHGIATWLYNNCTAVRTLLEKKWYFDEIYNFLFVNSFRAVGNFLWQVIDTYVIDGIPHLVVKIVARFSKTISLVQTGYVYHYATSMLIGVMVLIYWYYMHNL